MLSVAGHRLVALEAVAAVRGSAGSAPDGNAADAFFVLAMYDSGHGLTPAGLTEAIRRENTSIGYPVLTLVQVRGALAYSLARRRPPLVERAGKRWRLSGEGRKQLAVWCGDGDPARLPSGLGWPPGRVR